MDYCIILLDLYPEYHRYLAADEIRREATIKHVDMKKAVKLILLVGCVLLLSIPTALHIIPFFLDVQKYKPEIEKRVSEATGRPFSIGGQLELSLFPWAGLAFSDLRLGNPPGFKEKDFLSVKSFEARVKLLPLLSRDVQVKRFILEGPRIVLEKSRTGQGSWPAVRSS